MGLLDALMPSAKGAAMKMEPFVAPDVSELSDRELLERTYLTMCYVQHFASQIGMAAQTHPLLKSIVPQP